MDLPSGWEEREDAQGRKFYVDHVNKKTQWTRPVAAEPAAGTRANGGAMDDEAFARWLQEQEDAQASGSGGARSQPPAEPQSAAMSDEDYARMLQEEEDAAAATTTSAEAKEETKPSGGRLNLFGRRGDEKSNATNSTKEEKKSSTEDDEAPPPSEYEGWLQTRKEVKGLGWRKVYGRVCGSTLAIYSDEKKGKADLRIELTGAELSESESLGKLVSKKDEIARFKIAPSSQSKADSDLALIGKASKTALAETEFAADSDDQRAEWLGWCVAAGATLPTNVDLAGKLFKALCDKVSGPERAVGLRALAKACQADANDGRLARTLAANGVLTQVAGYLSSPPGQESAARIVLYASRADKTRAAAAALANADAAGKLVPLLTAADDGLQRWAAAALAPAIAGLEAKSQIKAAKGVVDGGGVFTLVALLSASSRDVQSHALAALVAVLEAALNSNDNLASLVGERAAHAEGCTALAPLCADPDPRAAKAALDCLAALHASNPAFANSVRADLAAPGGGAAGPLLATAAGQSKASAGGTSFYSVVAMRILADAVFCVDPVTGAEKRGDELVPAAARSLYARGALTVTLDLLERVSSTSLATSGESPGSLTTLTAALVARGRGFSRPSTTLGFSAAAREETTRLLAGLAAHAAGAADEAAQRRSLPTALVACVSSELAPSLKNNDEPPRCSAALPALALCLTAAGRRGDASPAVQAAQAGFLELAAGSGLLSVGSNMKGAVAARTALCIHTLLDTAWRSDPDAAGLVLALGTGSFTALLRMLEACAGALGDSGQGALLKSANAAILALGSLCGAARPFESQPPPTSEAACRRDVATSAAALLALAQCLQPTAPIDLRRAAARLLAALARDDMADARCISNDQQEFTANNPSLDALASTLAHAGLLGLAAANLDADDALLRADALDSFAALAPYSQGGDDRDVAAGAAALGHALARGLVAQDAAQRHSHGSNPHAMRRRALLAVEKAAGSLTAACLRGGDATKRAVALESPAPAALADLCKVYASPDDEEASVGPVVAEHALTGLEALARDNPARADAVVEGGAVQACTAVLSRASELEANKKAPATLIDRALKLAATLASIDVVVPTLLNTKNLLAALAHIVANRNADSARASIALEALSLLAIKVLDDPSGNAKLATATRKVPAALEALTEALADGSWGNRDRARRVLDAVAVAPVIEEDEDEVDEVSGLDPATNKRQVSSGRKVISKKDSDDEAIRRFEERLTAKRARENGIPQLTLTAPPRGAAADAKALATLVATRQAGDDDMAAVDRSCSALAWLIANDSTGATAATAIQARALDQLLVLAPHSTAAAACLSALAEVGELHKPLLLAQQPPTVAAPYVDAFAAMLQTPLLSSVSGDESDLEIADRAVASLAVICKDSDAAVLALAVALAARHRLVPAVAVLSSIAAVEANSFKQNGSDKDQSKSSCDGTLVLVSLLCPRKLDGTDQYQDLATWQKLTVTGNEEEATTHGEDDSVGALDEVPASIESLAQGLLVPVEDAEKDGDAAAAALADGVVFRGSRGGVLGHLLASKMAGAALERSAPALLGLLQRLPPGGSRARARRAIVRLAAASKTAATKLVASGAVDTAVALVAKFYLAKKGTFDDDYAGSSKNSQQLKRTAAADAACGLAILSHLVAASKEKAARAALAHDELLASLAAAVVSAVQDVDDPLAYLALGLLVELTDAGDVARSYVASRADLLDALLELCGSPSQRTATRALVVLANVAAGAQDLPAVAGLSGIRPVILSALGQTNEIDRIIAALRLAAFVFEADLIQCAAQFRKVEVEKEEADEETVETTEENKVQVEVVSKEEAAPVLNAAIESLKDYIDDNVTAAGYAIRAIAALTLAGKTIPALVALVEILIEKKPSSMAAVLEAAGRELCFAFSLDPTDPTPIITILLKALAFCRNEDDPSYVALASNIVSTLSSRLYSSFASNDAAGLLTIIDNIIMNELPDALNAIRDLSIPHKPAFVTVTYEARRLLAFLHDSEVSGAVSRDDVRRDAPDAPSTSAAASIAAALGALS